MKKNFLIISILILNVSFSFGFMNASEFENSGLPSSLTGSGNNNGWSIAPGGAQNSGVTVATLIPPTPTTHTTPVSNTSINSGGPTNHPFAELYSGLTQLNKLLLYSVDIYWNASTEPSSTTSICDVSNLPTSLQSIMQGTMGKYFGAACMPGSLPLQIANTIKTSLINYIKGMTQKLTPSYYDNTNGNDFINFIECQLNTNPGTFTGNLAYVDQTWNTTTSILDAIYNQLQSSNQFNNMTLNFFQNNIDSIKNAYTLERYQLIINWYTNLVTQLANRFNPTLFDKGLYSATIIPNTAALTGYSNAFIDACNNLTQYYNSLTSTGASYSVENYTLIINQNLPSSSQNTLFTDPRSFFRTLQNDIFNKLGNINAYMVSLGLKRANDRIQNIPIPATISPNAFTYDTLTNAPTFETSNQTGALPPFTVFPGTQLPASSDFYCAQQLLSSKNNFINSALDAFKFNTQLQEELFIYDNLSSTVISSYENEGLQAPEKICNDLLLNVNTNSSLLQSLQKRVKNSTPKKVAPTDSVNIIATDLNEVGDVFQELIIACNAALDTQYWYNESYNYSAAATYSMKATLLDNIVSSWDGACKLLGTTSDQPLSNLNQIYSQASELFFNSASSLLNLNLLPLNSYALTLSGYLKTTAYQNLMAYYASYYKESFTVYNTYLKTPPSYTYNTKTKTFSFDIVPGYEKYLFNIIYSIDEAISATISGYQTQLSFFLSQKTTDNSYLELIWPLQDALLVLTNFQEAITPLLLENPCALTSNGKSAFICGNDYQLLQTTAITTSENDIAPLIINAQSAYLQSYSLFVTIDKIMSKYPVGSDGYQAIQTYTSLDKIFQLSENNLTFSQFFLLHQARLYTSVAQRLIDGKPFFWQEGDPIKPQGSPYALLLYAYAAAIYQHLGYTQSARTVNAMKYLNFPTTKIEDFKKFLHITLEKPLATKTTQQIDGIYEQLVALHTILYLSPNNDTYLEFLQLLSHTIIPPSFYTTKSSPQFFPLPDTLIRSWGYADWLSYAPDTMPEYQLKAALYYYVGYLIASAKNHPSAQQFLAQANNQFNIFATIVENIFTTHHINDISQLLNQSFKDSAAVTKELNFIKNILNLKTIYQTTCLQMSFFNYVFAPNLKNPTILTLSQNNTPFAYNFLEGSLNLPGIIGDIYHAFGTKELLALQSSLYKSINKDLSSQFETIINYFTIAKDYYGIAASSDNAYQQKFLEAEHSLTNTYAYQSYISVIPLYNLTLPGITIPQQSLTPISGFNLPSINVNDAAQTFVEKSPLFLYKSRTTSIPVDTLPDFTSSSFNSIDILNNIAGPLHLINLTSQVKDTTSTKTIQEYNTNYINNFNTLCSQGITLNEQLIKGSLSYNVTKESSSNSTIARITQKELKLYNEPIPALPRFNAELYSAITYYANGCAKLYANSICPVNYQGNLLLPSNNAAGQDLTRKALFNTYLARTLELKSELIKLKQDKNFLALQTASLPELIKRNFYDTLPLYKQIQAIYEELIGLYISTNSFLSNYGVNSTAYSEIIAQTILEWMETNKSFLCGKPDINMYNALFHNLAQGTTQIKKYANQTANSDTYISKAALIFAQAYEYCAKAYNLLPATPLSTINPDTGAKYPNPATTSLPPYMQWKEAGTYYNYAGNFLEQVIANNPNFSEKTQNIIIEQAHNYFGQAINAFLHYSTYNIALFCAYAFQECRCTKNAQGGLKTVPVTTNNAQYPSWDYPFVGYLPHITPKTPYTYPQCQTDPKKGFSYIAHMPQTVYQGVASMEIPTFSFVKSQCSQGQPSTYTTMYNTMQQIFLNALYFYNQSTGLIKQSLPQTKISPTARTARQKVITKSINEWIIKSLNKNPGFYNPYTKKGVNLPTISIPTSSADEIIENGKATRVMQFQPLILATDLNLSLANSRQFYIHTLRYWSSRSDFYETLLNGLLQWCKPGSYDIAGTLLNDLTTMFNSFFIRSYLPTLKPSDAEYQVEQMIQNSQQDTIGSAAGYF